MRVGARGSAPSWPSSSSPTPAGAPETTVRQPDSSMGAQPEPRRSSSTRRSRRSSRRHLRFVPSRVPRRSLAGRCVAESHDRPAGSAVVVRVGTTGFERHLPNRVGACRSSGVTALRAGRTPLARSAGAPTPGSRAVGCPTRGSTSPAARQRPGTRSRSPGSQPGPHTSFVAVRQQGYVEVYPVVARVPVRISTTSEHLHAGFPGNVRGLGARRERRAPSLVDPRGSRRGLDPAAEAARA